MLASVGVLLWWQTLWAQTSRPVVLQEWMFDRPGDLQGWTPNAAIRNPRADADGLHFETTAHDPILTGPLFEIAASNGQVVEIDLACSRPGSGELYYTNKTEGRYGGFEPDLMSVVPVPPGPPEAIRTIRVWPFWGGLHKIIRIRFDPPGGARCRLRAIRILEGTGGVSRDTSWSFDEGTLGTWMPMYGLQSLQSERGRPLRLLAPEGQGLMITAVEPFDAAERRFLSVAADEADELALYWIAEGCRTLCGVNVDLHRATGSNGPAATLCDLAMHPLWTGRITHVGIGPTGRELRLRHVSIRPEQDISADRRPSPINRSFAVARRVPSVQAARYRADYVPPPRPVPTDYEIGIYYFPGWAPDRPDGTSSRWDKQLDFPKRDPLLGWYREGDPEVADWHVKWAVENGITFFVYDWYWRDGHVTLHEALHDGLFRSRYGDRIRFCVMWANHPPFSDHTKDQFVQVADYWVEHYLRRPNYYRVGGKAYVSFFHVGELQRCFGTDENLRDAIEAMRERVRRAGAGELYVVVCGDAGQAAQEWYRKVGIDAVTAYNYATAGSVTTQSPYLPFILGHEPIWRAAHRPGIVPYIPLLTVNWDARPWHGQATMARFGRQPRHFRAGLERLKAFLDETGGTPVPGGARKIALLEAWNEWGEGSYLEPNVEFGFDDLQVLRETFARKPAGGWPANVGPADVGLGPYDVRAVSTAPDGPKITPNRRVIEVSRGQVRLDGQAVRIEPTILPVPPLETRSVAMEDLVLSDGGVRQWAGGNRLLIDPGAAAPWNVLPRSLVPGSVRIESRDSHKTTFVEGRDYRLDTHWAAFEIVPGGRLKAGQRVRVSYTYSLRRVDAIVAGRDSRVLYLAGKPSADCPQPPDVPDGAALLATVYRPYNSACVGREHVFVPGPPAAPQAPGARPERTLARLRGGDPVTIVCWGDSVTAGGDASTPDKAYVRVFEQRLRRRFPSAKIRVINAGIGGTSTPGRLPAFEKEVLAHKPDLVTLEFVNDMGLPAETMQRNYDEILRRLRGAGAELVLITPHFVMPEWMGLPPHARGPDQRPYVRFLRQFARDNKVPLADAARRWEQLESLGIPYETLLRNGINHPDDRGHAIFAEELMRLFEQAPATNASRP